MNYDGWISGAAFFTAFILTLWPSKKKLYGAGILWVVGALADYSFAMIVQAIIKGFPLIFAIVPVLRISSIVAAGILLLPRVPREKARKGAITVFLIIVPLLFLVTEFANYRPGMPLRFPFGIGWLGVPLLWFRIREFADKYEEEPNNESLETNRR